MSRIKLLLDVVEGMRSLADSLQAVADIMTQEEPAQDMAERSGKKPKATAKKVAEKAEPTEPESAPSPAPAEKPLTLEEVRGVLAEKSRAGHTAKVRELLIKHGADKLSDIDPANYPALLKDAEVL
ncbi:MAG: rRNA biogenesis protein rrp5 [Hespellia sp.]|nr:rRNA biogenesis protein rrp5 [Hespellia sp.]